MIRPPGKSTLVRDAKIIHSMLTDWDYLKPQELDLYKLQKVKASDLRSMLEAYDNKILRDGIRFNTVIMDHQDHRLKMFPDNAVWISYRSYRHYHVALIKITSYIFEESNVSNTLAKG